MNRRVLGAAMGGLFALGVLTGAASAVVIRDATNPVGVAAMNGSMGDMGSMMGGGSMMPSASAMPGNQHEQHHPGATR